MVVELDRLKKLGFDPYGGASWAITHTGWSTLDVKTEIALGGDRPMSCAVRLGLLGTQKVKDMRKTPGDLRFGGLYHENDLVGAEARAIPTANTLISENLHHTVGVPHNGIARWAILEARGPFTVATGDGDMHMGEARTRGAFEATLAMVRRRTGRDTIVASDAFRFIDQ
jgi:hypothetical protein